MLADLRAKLEFAETLPSQKAATVQALLAVAARKRGQEELSNWLLRRAELLADIEEMQARRPMLKELAMPVR
jgi:uncharacterized protein YfdQ (DUF2303 family)